MKKPIIIAVAIFSLVVMAGCKKTISYSNIEGSFGSVAFINASATDSLPVINIYVDTVLQTYTAPLAYKGLTGYISVNSGVRNIQIKGDTILYKNVAYASLPSEQINAGTAFTYMVYDTMAKPNRNLRILKLTDDLSSIKTKVAKVRFVNLAVRSTPVDVTFLRTSVTPNDSVTISNAAYVGSSPNVSQLSAFGTELPIGAYTAKLKTAGTQTVLATQAVNMSTYYVGAFYTFYCTGTTGKQAISLGSMKH